MLTYHQQLLLAQHNALFQLGIVVVDKLLIGGILALSALLASRLIELYKIKLSFTSELARKRVEKISGIWSAIYSFQATLENLATALSNAQHCHAKELAELAKREYSEDESYKEWLNVIFAISKTNTLIDAVHQLFSDARPELETETKNVLQQAQDSRFLIGDDLYSAILNHMLHISASLPNFDSRTDDDTTAIEEFKNQVAKSEKSLRDLSARFLEPSWHYR